MDPTVLNWIKRMAERHGAPGWMPAAPRRAVASMAKRMQHRFHVRVARRAVSGRLANLDDIEQFLGERSVALKAPIVLVSQVQRSGGSLMSQLFDGHPRLAAYPQELRFGDQATDRWPPLDPNKSSRENFFMLVDHNFPRMVRRGMTKGYRNPDRHPFLLITRVQYTLFNRLWETVPPKRPRDIADHFFTAFFNAWLNFQGDLKQKTWITAFAPRLAREEASARAFFETYPDGKLIQIVRDPMTWYPSAKYHIKSGAPRIGPDKTLSKWCRSTEAILRNKAEFGDKVIVVRFEDLVGRTEPTMRALCDELAIPFDPVLLEPTFNGHAMRANSSFEVDATGLIDAPLQRAETLTSDERKFLEKQCGGLYARAMTEAIVITDGAPALNIGTA